jgi:hypothetical protein
MEMSLKHSTTWFLGGLTICIGCTGDVTNPSDIPDNIPRGEVTVELAATDGTAGTLDSTVDEVWVRVQDVLVRNQERGWLNVGTGRMDIDLMTLRGGDALQIGIGDVFEGAYNRLRLVIVDSWIVVNGVESELLIDGGLEIPTDNVDFREPYFITENTSTNLALTWDLNTELAVDDGDWSLTTGGSVAVTIGAN